MSENLLTNFETSVIVPPPPNLTNTRKLIFLFIKQAEYDSCFMQFAYPSTDAFGFFIF